MVTRPSRFMPFAVSSRYLLREFVAMLTPIVFAFVILYLIVDFFDRLDILLKNHAAASATVRYFLFKVPLILTQVMPPAVLAALLLSLGMVSRRNEIIALRASGVSLTETAMPLLGTAALISLATLGWNETVVPYCTRQYQYVNNVEIRKRPQRAILSERGIWYHGVDGFYSIDHIDPQRQTLFGLTIYRVGPSFELRSVLQVTSAHWTGVDWVTAGVVERTTRADGDVVTSDLPGDRTVIHETLADFLEVRREPEELSYLALRRHIEDLSRKGIDVSSYLVDLYMKLAVPFTTLVLAGVAIPLAGRVQRHASVAAIVGAGLAIGFVYWVVLALTRSLGQTGILPALAAAWASNVIYALVGVALHLSSE